VLLLADQEPTGGEFTVRTVRNAGRTWDWYGNPGYGALGGFVTAARDAHDFDVGGFSFRSDLCESCDRLSGPLAVGRFVGVSETESGNTGLFLPYAGSLDTTLVGPVEAVDTAAGSLIVQGITVQSTPATLLTSDEQNWVGSPALDIDSISVGDTVTVDGGALDDLLVASSITTVGNGVSVHTRNYVLADPALIILGQTIMTDAFTEVIRCDNYDRCVWGDLTWIFGNSTDPKPWLTIVITPRATQLHAKQIIVLVPDI
jgi:hypothetical protein